MPKQKTKQLNKQKDARLVIAKSSDAKWQPIRFPFKSGVVNESK